MNVSITKKTHNLFVIETDSKNLTFMNQREGVGVVNVDCRMGNNKTFCMCKIGFSMGNWYLIHDSSNYNLDTTALREIADVIDGLNSYESKSV